MLLQCPRMFSHTFLLLAITQLGYHLLREVSLTSLTRSHLLVIGTPGTRFHSQGQKSTSG